MTKPFQIALGVGFGVLAVMVLMNFDSRLSSVRKRKDPATAEDLEAKGKEKATKDPNAGKPAVIEEIRAALKGSSIDAFDGVPMDHFLKFQVDELTDLKKAILSQRQYKSEGQFRQMDPASFATIMTMVQKITGKRVSV